MAYSAGRGRPDVIYKSVPVTVERRKGVTLVEGLATSGEVDRDGQIVDPEWARRAIAEWKAAGGPIRQSHDPHRAVGTGVAVSGLRVRSRIVDKQARKLLRYGVLKAYSIGIARPVIVRDARAPGGRIVGGEIMELSIVDVPSNPSATIEVVKTAPNGTPLFIGKAAVMRKGKKGKARCAGCGFGVKMSHAHCAHCGRANDRHRIGRTVKAARAELRSAPVLTKAASAELWTSAAGGLQARNRDQAVRALLLDQAANDANPAVRDAARGALARL